MTLSLLEKSIEKVKDSVLKASPENYKIFLFGSMAVGSDMLDSDIDVGFLGTKQFPRDIFSKMKDELEESIVPYKVDLIDFYDKDASFKQTALKKIVPWKN